MPLAPARVDAVTFAVIRHKLNQVIDEAILALENVSGSPTTAEGHDMMVSLYRADGGLMVGGVGFLHHLSSAAQAVKVIIASFSDDPGIHEGDAYMLNDSYVAALHPPDVYIISPIYHAGALRGFVANFVHVTDIGAIDPGGFSPNSRNRFHEGFQTRGLKIVEAGRPRRDVIETILNQVREPDAVALDLRSQLAANHVATERMQALYAEYGPDVVDAVSESLIEQSEALMRSRLRELPDGVWRARQYVDMPDKLHNVEVALTKKDDGLTFDFTGTSAQSELGINNSYWATLGGALAPLYPLLAWDITWNEGMLRPVRLIAPEGTLVNCQRPSPVSVATVAMVKVVNSISNYLLGRMLDASETYHGRASAVWDGVHASMMLSGRWANGESFIVSITDKFAGAGGAVGSHDGIDIGGELPNGVSRWANAETHELHNPVLYLYRRALTDSGGPGAYRGGVTHEWALIPHGHAHDSISLVLTSMGIKVPVSMGLSGGYPGSNACGLLFRGVNATELPERLEETTGNCEEVQWGEFVIGTGDALYMHYMGGGGYGDPLARPPEDIAADVSLGVVSRQAAVEIYGVCLSDAGEPDAAATERTRLHIRELRLGAPVDDRCSRRREVPTTGRRINHYLQSCRDGVQCTWCGEIVARSKAAAHELSEQWKTEVPCVEREPSVAGVRRKSLDDLVLRLFLCPTCATVLDTEIALPGDQLVHDTIENWPDLG